jgi:hypothetical protein
VSHAGVRVPRTVSAQLKAAWIRPTSGHTGNHIVVVRGVFDYHGSSNWSRYWTHTVRHANQWWPGWSADVVHIRAEALVSRRRAREYEGLWMKEPPEFLFDPLARAGRYLQKFPARRPSAQQPDDVLASAKRRRQSCRKSRASLVQYVRLAGVMPR